MQRLVDAFLDFARGNAESGVRQSRRMCRQMVAQIVQDARRGGTDVSLQQVDGQRSVTLRPMAMRRAVENLIGNAVRYGTRCVVG